MISSQDLCTKKDTEEFKIQTISLIAHENMCTRLSKIIKNLIVIILVLIGTIVAMVAGILYTINQYNLEQHQDEQVSIDSDLSNNGGKNLICGGNYYGEGNDSKKENNR